MAWGSPPRVLPFCLSCCSESYPSPPTSSSSGGVGGGGGVGGTGVGKEATPTTLFPARSKVTLVGCSARSVWGGGDKEMCCEWGGGGGGGGGCGCEGGGGGGGWWCGCGHSPLRSNAAKPFCIIIMVLRAEAAARSSRLIPEQHRIWWRLGVRRRLPWSIWLARPSAFLLPR